MTPIPPEVVPRSLFRCPLDGCEWMYLARDVKATEDTLAGVFGRGVMLAVNQSQVLADTERAIEDHLKTHTIVEWLNTVVRLRAELLRLAGVSEP